METKRDQSIIANLADLDNYKAVIAYAAHAAKRFNKGLILLHVTDPRYKEDPSAVEEKLKAIQAELSDLPQVSYMATKGSTKEFISALPTLLNGILAITATDPEASHKSPLSPKNVLKDFSTCRIAYLVVQTDQTEPVLRHVALTIDFHRESKEKLIWSSYFARFGASTLHVLYHDYKDEGLRQKWYDNMRFLNKFYTNLGLTFLPHIVPGNASNVDADALPFMEEKQMDLLVTVTTKEKDIFDSLLGPQENRTVKNPQKIPVLFLNPRNDLYVLCD